MTPATKFEPEIALAKTSQEKEVGSLNFGGGHAASDRHDQKWTPWSIPLWNERRGADTRRRLDPRKDTSMLSTITIHAQEGAGFTTRSISKMAS
jgi:hypothetical protein